MASQAVTIAASACEHPCIYKSASGLLPPPPTTHSATAQMIQRPTLTDVLVRSTSDSHVIFQAVAQKLLPLITKRLTHEERRDLIRPGSVFVWEERGPESGSGEVSGWGRRLTLRLGVLRCSSFT